MSKLKTWLFNPFHYIAGGTALILGTGLLIVTAIWAYFIDITFDGMFHLNIVSYGFINELIRQLVIVVVMTGLLWGAGIMLSNTKFRLIDLAGTQIVARWPIQLFTLIIYSIPVMNNTIHVILTFEDRPFPELGPVQNMIESALRGFYLFTSPVGFLLMAWTVVLMYKSFAVSCNVNGGKAIAVFGVVLLAGNFLSAIITDLI